MYGDYVGCVLQAILQEIVQGLNIEKVLPSYKYSITSRSATLLCSRYTQCMLTVCVLVWYSCLAGLRILQKNGHLPTDSSLFREYARYYVYMYIIVRISFSFYVGSKDNFIEVRLTALKALVDIVQGRESP